MNLVPFQYGGIALSESCTIKGAPYFTRRAIGEWLGYSNPKRAVAKIIERNPHIEKQAWSRVVKLTTLEGARYATRTTRVYNPVALQLIIFESRQPKAIRYKVAVAELVVDLMTGKYMRD